MSRPKRGWMSQQDRVAAYLRSLGGEEASTRQIDIGLVLMGGQAAKACNRLVVNHPEVGIVHGSAVGRYRYDAQVEQAEQALFAPPAALTGAVPVPVAPPQPPPGRVYTESGTDEFGHMLVRGEDGSEGFVLMDAARVAELMRYGEDLDTLRTTFRRLFA